MKRFFTVVSLGVALVASSGLASAQERGGAGSPSVVDAGGPTLVYGDLYPEAGTTVIDAPAGDAVARSADPAPVPETSGDSTAPDRDAAAVEPGNTSAAPGTVTHEGDSGTSLLGPDGTYRVTEVAPADITVGGSEEWAPAPEPAPDAAPDAVEAEIGPEPSPPDADGDGIGDDDEVGLYGTDPWLWDTDGDGLSDGEELFTAGTDPLIWDTDSGDAADGTDASAAGSDPLVAEGAAADALSVDSDNDRLADADEASVGTDPTTPDADGDGYYDGDEVNLGTDPLDPASFPTEEHPPSEEQPSSAA